jgi:hypothetical protein
MTQHLIEPLRFPLPEAWSMPATAARPAGTPRQQSGGAMKTLALTFAAALAAAALSSAQAQPQAGAAGVGADLRMAQDAAPMRAAADAFSARAMAGDRTAALSMLSPALVARMGPEATARVLDAQILPFFQRGRALGRSTTVTHTTDANGGAGFAFYQWLEMRDGSEARPFTLYIVREQERLVVANVVPDRLVPGRHR